MIRGGGRFTGRTGEVVRGANIRPPPRTQAEPAAVRGGVDVVEDAGRTSMETTNARLNGSAAAREVGPRHTKSRMKVLHVITGLHKGGAEGALVRLVTNDDANEHHVTALTGGGAHAAFLHSRGVPVHCLELPRGRLTLHALRACWRLVRDVRPDVIQTWMYHPDLIGGFLGRASGIPVVWGLRTANLDPRDVSARTTAIIQLAAAMSRWLPHAIVSCSEEAARAHIARGYDRSRIVVIPNGYEVDRLAPDPAARSRLRAAWGVPETCFLAGMVARWDPLKDHTTLLAALEFFAATHTGDWRCALVGDGMAASNAPLMDLLARRGVRDRVLLLGPSDDIPGVMNALDVSVLSSVVEGFPNVVAEAMACGTPCVVTAVGDAGLIVGDTGWVVPARDPQRMADALTAAAAARADGIAWSSRKSSCRTRVVARFSIDRMVAAYRDAWTDACA